MKGRNHQEKWYHGSPYKLTELREGSTITHIRDLARIFSHKPEFVCVDDQDLIKHNGKQPGFLYEIAEVVTEKDVIPHPRTAMPPGYEWLITRSLQVKLIGETQPDADELLSEQDIARIIQAHAD